MQAGGGRLSLSTPTDGDKCAMVIFFEGGGINKQLLKHVFGLYSLPIIFSTLARLRFILNLQMQYVLPTPFIGYIFFFIFGVIIPDCQLPKFTENAHKIAQIAYKMSKNCLRGWGTGVGGGEAWRKRGES